MTEQKSIQQLLREYKEELQGKPETEATEQFAKDLDEMTEEYDGIAAIVQKYRAAHATFGDQIDSAKRLRDEVESWVDEEEEIPKALRDAIRALWQAYETKKSGIVTALSTAKSALDLIRSPLDKARAGVDEADATFGKTKEFEARVEGWFTDLNDLHKTAKEHLEAKSYRLVFGHFLEIEAAWQRIRNLNEAVGQEPARTPEWLKGRLDAELRAALAARRARYLAHADWLAKTKAVETAAANHKSFVEEGGRRKEFLREAQDVEPAAPPSGHAAIATEAAA